MIGARIPRVEDARFLRGEGRYVADIRLPFAVEAHVVRSPHAHARLRAIDTRSALVYSGVEAVITGNDRSCGEPKKMLGARLERRRPPFLEIPVLVETRGSDRQRRARDCIQSNGSHCLAARLRGQTRPSLVTSDSEKFLR